MMSLSTEDQDAGCEPRLSCKIAENYTSESNDHDKERSHPHKALRALYEQTHTLGVSDKERVWFANLMLRVILCICDF